MTTSKISAIIVLILATFNFCPGHVFASGKKSASALSVKSNMVESTKPTTINVQSVKKVESPSIDKLAVDRSLGKSVQAPTDAQLNDFFAVKVEPMRELSTVTEFLSGASDTLVGVDFR